MFKTTNQALRFHPNAKQILQAKKTNKKTEAYNEKENTVSYSQIRIKPFG